MWFNNLMGFAQQSPDQVRKNLALDGTRLTSLVNGKSYECGMLQIPKLEELRHAGAFPRQNSGPPSGGGRKFIPAIFFQ